MHIKTIFIDGFKSYGKRTEISGFDKEFTAITGFNGSGKSNICDAICWVLNISNLGKMRVQSKQGLIYRNGATGVEFAYVTIIFDNSKVEAQPFGYHMNEITITKQISIKGVIKYYINGRIEQVQEITNLFLSCQMNVNNPHFLIQQGRITKILGMQPLEVLGMLQEATGVSLYEKNRKESLNILHNKDQKLAQIKEIVEEMTPKIIQYRKEKEKLEKFHDYQKELAENNRLYVAWKSLATRKEIEQIEFQKTTFNEQINEYNSNINESKQQSEEINEKIKILRKDQNKELDDKLKNFEAILADKEKKAAIELGDLKSAREMFAADKKKFLADKRRMNDDENILIKKRSELEKFEEKFRVLRENNDNAMQNLEEAKKYLETLQTGVVMTDEGKQSSLQEQLSLNSNQKIELETKKRILQTEMGKNEMEIKKLLNELKNFSRNSEDNKKKINQLKKEISNYEISLKSLNHNEEHFKNLKDQLQNSNAKLQNLRAKKNQFDRQFPNTVFNYSDPEPNFDRRKVIGMVCKKIKINDPKVYKALELSASGRLFNIIVDKEITCTQLLKNGNLKRRTFFIPLDKIRASKINDDLVKIAKKLVGPENVNTALSYISCDKNVQQAINFVFGDIFVVSDFDAATKVAYDKRINKTCVTLEGDIVRPDGLATGGFVPEDTGKMLKVLQDIGDSLSELDQLEYELKTLQNDYNKRSESSLKYNKILETIDSLKIQLQFEISSEENSEFNKYQNQITKLQTRNGEIKKELNECEENLTKINRKIQNLEEQLSASSKNSAEKLIKDQKEKVDKLSKNAEASRKLWEKHENNYSALKNEIEALTESLETDKNQISDMEIKLKTSEDELLILEENYKEIQKNVNEIKSEIKKLKDEIRASSSEISGLINQQEALNQKVDSYKLEIKKIGKNIEETEEKLTALKEQLKENCKENKNITAQELEQARNLTKKEAENLIQNVNKLSQTIKEMERSVNFDSLHILKTYENSYNDVNKKKQIIFSDRDKILAAIKDLDEKKEQELLEAFNKVNENFGKIFQTMVPGEVDCKLQMLSGKKITAGLQILVKMGPRWVNNLNELSGGQRSLVAFSLILALLKFSPAPIYILDEIDSALDLGNTENMGQMIKKFFGSSQFIIISLKEGLFSNSNVLFKVKFANGMSEVSRISKS